MKYRGLWWRRPWANEAGARDSIQSSKAPCIPEKGPRILSVRRSLLALVERKQTVVRDQIFPQEPPGSRLVLADRGLALSWLVDNRATLHLRRIWRVPTRWRASRLPTIVLPASRVPLPPEERQIGTRMRCTPGNTTLNQPYYRRRVSTDRLNREDSQLDASLEGGAGHTPTGKTLSHSYPKKQISEGQGTRM